MSEELENKTLTLLLTHSLGLVKAGIINKEQHRIAQNKLRYSFLQNGKIRKKLISKKEAAEMLGFKSTRSIDRLEQTGVLIRSKSSHLKQVKYYLKDVLAVMDGEV